jgi:uncharacterized hydrophobic protein (TIGR00271 family)
MSDFSLVELYVPFVSRIKLSAEEAARVQELQAPPDDFEFFSVSHATSVNEAGLSEAERAERRQGHNALLKAEWARPGGTPGPQDGIVTVEGGATVVYVHVARHVRHLLQETRAEMQFLSEHPYKVGSVRWTEISFTCRSLFAEEAIKRLQSVGVGIKGGVGMICVLPVKLHKLASMPAAHDPPVLGAGAGCAASSTAGGAASSARPATVGTAPAPASGSVAGAVGAAAPAAPALLLFAEPGLDEVHDAELHDERAAEAAEEDEEERGMMINAAAKFYESVTARIAVDQVVETVQSGAAFTFDYFVFLLCAGIIACVGLVTNGTVAIVASMLISPLMGPILGLSLGWTLNDTTMIRTGLISECIGLATCILVGFLGGLCAAPVVGNTWPTPEMWSRMGPGAIWTGIAIAIPSGVGVALSVLSASTSGLIGVAISASLLPPAVNTGIVLAMACFYNTTYLNITDINSRTPDIINEESILRGAGWSFLLTLVNIVCIVVSASVMLKIKEVAPAPRHEAEFWRTSVPRARKYFNDTIRKDAPETLRMRQELKRQLDRQRGAPASPDEQARAASIGELFRPSQPGGANANHRKGRTSLGGVGITRIDVPIDVPAMTADSPQQGAV